MIFRLNLFPATPSKRWCKAFNIDMISAKQAPRFPLESTESLNRRLVIKEDFS